MARKEPLRAVKGMRDILPPESALWEHIEDVARKIFRAYAYQEIRTPLVEPTELFARGVGTDTDIVTKEMYTWEDRDKSSLTLRPEATASVIRAYIEHRRQAGNYRLVLGYLAIKHAQGVRFAPPLTVFAKLTADFLEFFAKSRDVAWPAFFVSN